MYNVINMNSFIKIIPVFLSDMDKNDMFIAMPCSTKSHALQLADI